MVALFAILFCWISVVLLDRCVRISLFRHTVAGQASFADGSQQDAETLAAHARCGVPRSSCRSYNEQVADCRADEGGVPKLHTGGQLEFSISIILSDTREAKLALRASAWATRTQEAEVRQGACSIGAGAAENQTTRGRNVAVDFLASLGQGNTPIWWCST